MLAPTTDTAGRAVMGLSLAFEGPPGNAKSARIHKAVYDLGLHTEILRPASMSPSDIRGIPTPVELEVGGTTQVFNQRTLPMWAYETHKRPTCVFIEELTAGSSQQNMAMLLGVMQDRKLDSFALGADTRFCTVYNPESCAVGGMPIEAPMSNRLITVPVMYDPMTDSVPHEAVARATRAWAEWYRTADDVFTPRPAPDVEHLRRQEGAVRAVWREEFALARELVTKFVEETPPVNGEYMGYHLPPPEDPSFSRGWRSFRSNDTAARILAISKIRGLSDDQTRLLLVGAVGSSWVDSFSTFFSYRDLPNGKQFFAGEWENFDFEADVMKSKVVLSTALSYAVGTADDKERVEQVWTLGHAMVRALAAGSDVVASVHTRMEEANLYKPPTGFKDSEKSPHLVRRMLQKEPEIQELLRSLRGG
jgi:hypothetical protein